MLRVLFQGNCFGVVQSGGFSEYQIAQFSSWDISVAFPGQTNRMEYVYVDYPGRFVYGKGWFTYDLRLHDNDPGPGQHLDVDVQQDE
jgi:hypothetical protein